MADLPPDIAGGGIVYCASRKQTEDVAKFLREKGMTTAHFHAGLSPDRKSTSRSNSLLASYALSLPPMPSAWVLINRMCGW